MKCPRCGTEFEATVEQCFTCGLDFTENPDNFKPRTSKLAILSLVLGILCLFTFYLPLLAAVVIGVVALRKIRKSRGKLTGERIAMAGILIPLLSLPIISIIGYAIWSKDAAPVPNEFTEADLIKVKPENESSWGLLLQLNEGFYEKAAPVIGLSEDDLKMLHELSTSVEDSNSIEELFKVVQDTTEQILYLWDQSVRGRAIIEKLNKYDEISDQTVPHIESINGFCSDVRYLTNIYHLYSLMQAVRGNDKEGVENLILFDSVIRKYSVSARSMGSKLVCYKALSEGIETSNIIACYADVSDEVLLLVEEHFAPFHPEFLSYKNCIIYEYLMFKNTMGSYFTEVTKGFLIKRNSILRYYHGFCQNWIALDTGQEPAEYCEVSVWPWESPNWPKVLLHDSACEVSFKDPYFLYNPVGHGYMAICMPAFNSVSRIKKRVLIHDDMLQWVIAQRLGREGSLNARAYSDEYTVDVEKGLVFSIGPDGEPYTDDDIKLRIAPEVLGLK